MGPLLRPADVLRDLPLSDAAAASVARTRDEAVRILNGDDPRLIVVVGPCSVHDPEAGIDYARRLRQLAGDLAGDLLIVMRLYFEKPRTTVGWKGLINDPYLNGS
ncbi:MAG: 3-deoxy-7-phosphoheptulonate synthase, partial [Chloroflexota bacterium]